MDLFEEKHHIQLLEHFLSGLVEKLSALPLEPDSENSEHCVDPLNDVVEQIIPSESIWGSLFRHVESRCKVELVGSLVVKCDDQQQENKRSQQATNICERVEYLLELPFNNDGARRSEEVDQTVDIGGVVEIVSIGEDSVDDRPFVMVFFSEGKDALVGCDLEVVIVDVHL